MTALELSDISYSYTKENEKNIENFSLKVEKGSFTTLLGPSGCGKTTLLRLIAGFLEPDSGKIFVNEVDQKKIPPEKRKIGIVFQDYALFPHLTVYQNIAYGLKINKEYKKLNKYELKQRVEETAKSLDLESLLDRFPHEISGGQQQRVALARVLVLNPEILLMDEPLSSLDTKLRIKVRDELKEIQKKLQITTIYVTHDQEEALSLSDNIAIINHGKLEQYGTPDQIYFEPVNTFTAEIAGNANFIEKNGNTILIRPEWFELATTATSETITATILSKSFLGDKNRLTLQTTNQILTVDLPYNQTKNLPSKETITLTPLHQWSFNTR